VSPDAAPSGTASAGTVLPLTIPLTGPAIVLCTSGSVALNGHELERGHAFYVADEPSLHVSGDGMLFIASTG
jgi:mannose-6-phosphate isomerase class I